MIYSNPEFFILFSIVLGLFLAVRNYSFRFWLLISGSLFFYAWSGFFDTFIFLSVVTLSWLSTLFATFYPKNQSKWLTTGIVLMAAHLFFWKYAPWLTETIQTFFPGFLSGRKLLLPLPIGISFFTLQGIAYLVDLRRGEAEFIPFSRYLLFKSFFPQLVAGPIVRVHQLLPQLRLLDTPRLEMLGRGLCLFSIGFLKKILIADRIAPDVDLIFKSPSEFNQTALLLGLLGYTIQIWADFSAYTDMGRGTAQMLGINLPENFLSPYLSKTPSEFWRRWHITLSEWIRDYIYIPLGGNRGSRLRVVSVLLFTMAVSGLWHGAAFTFILWGVYHGLLLIAERGLKHSKLNIWFEKYIPTGIKNLLLTLIMFLLTAFGWLIFRAQNLSTLSLYLKGLWSHSPSLKSLDAGNIGTAFLLCTFLHFVFYYDFNTQSYPVSKIQNWFFSSFSNRAIPVVGFLLGLLIAGIITVSAFLSHSGSSAAFIYFQF
jgi:alginate O-acetyltransferase complex protein AlgI